MRAPRRPRRICIAPVDTASYYSGLRQGFVELGIPCWFFCFDASSYTRYQPAADAFWLERLIFAVAKSRARARSPVGRRIWDAMLLALRLVALACAVIGCDVFVFAFSCTFVRGLELPLLRAFGRTIVCVFNGSDTRPPWMSGIFALGPGTPDPDAILAETRRQQARLRRLERSATALVCHPLSAHLLRRPFINHLQIGLPCGIAVELPTAARAGGPLKIVHAPTRPLQKGSDRFQKIVAQLRQEGHAIDFIELTGRPNHEVLAAIATCDLVLDEAYSDTPLAGLGCEAACAGRPAVVGGYGNTDVTRFAQGTGLPMRLFVHPDDLERTVRELVRDVGLRRQCGREARDFVRTYWTPKAVAEKFLAIFRGEAPDHWTINPARLGYWQGWGAPESAVRETIARCVGRHGVGSLGLTHNPVLERQLAGFAAIAATDHHATPTLG